MMLRFKVFSKKKGKNIICSRISGNSSNLNSKFHLLVWKNCSSGKNFFRERKCSVHFPKNSSLFPDEISPFKVEKTVLYEKVKNCLTITEVLTWWKSY